MKLQDFKFRAYEAGKRISKRDFALNLLEHFHYDSEVPYLDEDTRQIELFTGLYDKNGKEIYEGDILAIESSASKRENQSILSVHYDDKSLSFKFLFKGYSKEQNNQFWKFESLKNAYGDELKLEIIGNIHENAELLKERESE